MQLAMTHTGTLHVIGGHLDPEQAQAVIRFVTQALAHEREVCAKIAETTDYAVGDAGPPEPGKMLSGTITINNRGPGTPMRIAEAIRARHS